MWPKGVGKHLQQGAGMSWCRNHELQVEKRPSLLGEQNLFMDGALSKLAVGMGNTTD
jgi:hypothetical protein